VPEGLRSVKAKEKRWYERIIQSFSAEFDAARVVFRKFLSWGKSRVVIALIPQSEKRARKVELNHFSVLVIAIMAALIAFGAIAALARYGAVALKAGSLDEQLSQSRKSIEALRDSTEKLLSEAARFEEKLGKVENIVLSNGKTGTVQNSSDLLKTAGLTDLISNQWSDDPVSRDILRLNSIADTLDKSLPSLDDIANVIATQKDIMTEVPNIWPIQGNMGHITMYFGQNENPFSTGQWYLHTGIDISTNRQGDSILATADGKVIDIHYDPSLGNSLTIQHSHGFTTRYGHLRSFVVKKGQRVSQGDTIAYLGNTGKTTGPHLHYEVYLGTSLIDPLRFLSIRKEFHE